MVAMLIVALLIPAAVIAGDKEKIKVVKKVEIIEDCGGDCEEDCCDQAFLGVYLRELDDAVREAMNYEEPGIMVEDVVKEGAAAKEGIKAGDIIVSVEDKAIFNTKRLQKIISRFNPDDVIKVKIYRDGKQKIVDVKLGKREQKSAMMMKHKGGHGKDVDIMVYDDAKGNYHDMLKDFNLDKMMMGKRPPVYLGVHIEDITDQLGDFFGVKEGHGALVSKVVEESPAEKAGVKAGDVIIKIGDDMVKETGDIKHILVTKEPGTKVKVIVVRDKKEKTLKFKLEAPPEDWGMNWKGLGEDIKLMADDLLEEFVGEDEDGHKRIKIKVKTHDGDTNHGEHADE